jgi:hypothetical protein
MRFSGAIVLRGDSLVLDALLIAKGQLRDIGADRTHYGVTVTEYWVCRALPTYTAMRSNKIWQISRQRCSLAMFACDRLNMTPPHVR